MNFTEFTQGLRISPANALASLRIEGLAYNSTRVGKGFAFIAVRGFAADGHRFIAQAIQNGASLIVAESLRRVKKTGLTVKEGHIILAGRKVPFLVYPRSRQFLSRASANFYRHPSLELNVIGITGTNGKTTTAFLAEKILSDSGLKTGLIGTIHYRIGRTVLPAPHTTPESLDLHALLRQMADRDVRTVVMEVSSHSLALGRVDDVHFNTAVFTNLTEDHFDFHKNYLSYFKAKKKLFDLLLKSGKKVKTAFINRDDPYGRKLLRIYGKQKKFIVTSYGLSGGADLTAGPVRTGLDRTEFDFPYKGRNYPVRSGLIGRHNVYNILAAMGTGLIENVRIDRILRSLKRLKKVKGRLEVLKVKDFFVGIDYAHTEDALKNVLAAVRELNPERIITVFGCGGDRDRFKRPLMARAASAVSDIVIATSDNPRTEDPRAILDDVEKGIRRGTEYYRIENRRDAIKKALSFARRNDFLLIAGKGHEDYQIIGKTRVPFDDRKAVLDISGE